MPADRYVSPTGPSRHEVEIKRSRFIACILPVVDEAQARAQLSELRREFHDARHCCSAYLLGAGIYKTCRGHGNLDNSQR